MISASNENETIRNSEAQEFQLFAGDFLTDDKEALLYLESLNYFENLFKNKTLENKLKSVEQIKEITNFNPFEMMELNKWFKIHGFNELEEVLIEKYTQQRFRPIQSSHKNFVEEVLKDNPLYFQDFLTLYSFMDTEVKISEEENYLLAFADLNVMEIRDNCVYSVAPIYVKALKQIYTTKKIREIMSNEEQNFFERNYKLYIDPLNKKGKGGPFQRCVEIVLTQKYENSKNFVYSNSVCNSYEGDDQDFLKFSVNCLMILSNPSYHFVDFLLFRVQTANLPASN